MKKLLTLALAAMMVFNLAGCGSNEEAGTGNTDQSNGGGTTEVLTEGTVGEILLSVFKNKSGEESQAIADEITTNHVPFMGATMEVEPGLLAGFDNFEVTGFDKGIMFGPAMGTIPFVGYIFELAEGADVEAIKKTIKDKVNPRKWVCVEAENVYVESKGDLIILIMSNELAEDIKTNFEKLK